MQLPRGIFCEIKKGTPVPALLNDIHSKRFSGICIISSGPKSGTFVFRSGVCILAEFKEKTGDRAFQELLELKDMTVDAALSSLDEAQIKLSLEFNKAARISSQRAGLTPAEKSQNPIELSGSAKKRSLHHRVVAPEDSLHEGKNRDHVLPPAVRQSGTPGTTPAKNLDIRDLFEDEQTPSSSLPTKEKPPGDPDSKIDRDEKTEPACTGSDSFGEDIDTIGAMDLERVSEKIRTDCKTLVKSLDLEHLIKDDKK